MHTTVKLTPTSTKTFEFLVMFKPSGETIISWGTVERLIFLVMLSYNGGLKCGSVFYTPKLLSNNAFNAYFLWTQACNGGTVHLYLMKRIFKCASVAEVNQQQIGNVSLSQLQYLLNSFYSPRDDVVYETGGEGFSCKLLFKASIRQEMICINCTIFWIWGMIFRNCEFFSTCNFFNGVIIS